MHTQRLPKGIKTLLHASRLSDAPDECGIAAGMCGAVPVPLSDYVRDPSRLNNLAGRNLRIIAGKLARRVQELESLSRAAKLLVNADFGSNGWDQQCESAAIQLRASVQELEGRKA